MFCSSQAELTGLLTNALQEVPEELIALISRIDEGGVSLHDLSDADIALLRDYDQDAWFTVTRKAD
jgi:hypothetical protein